jgi:hypothetical protein
VTVPRRLWQAAAVLAILVLFAVFAWPQGDDDGVGGGPLNAIAAAAEKTRSEPGGRAAIRAVFTSPDPSESFTMTGRTVYDEEMGRSRTVMKVPDPDSDGLTEMEMVMDGSVFYMRSSVFGSLPDGRDWMSFDMSVAAGLEMPVPAEGDPKDELQMLEAATGVRKLGKEQVRGVQTTHYGGVVDVSEQASSLRELGAEDLATRVEEKGAPARLEVWIDAEGLTRRMRILSTEPAEGDEGPTTVDMRMEFFDCGTIAAIELPDEDEVFDATSMAEEELDE